MSLTRVPYAAEWERQQISLRRDGTLSTAWTMFEVVNAAHRLSQALSRTKPRRRGRGR